MDKLAKRTIRLVLQASESHSCKPFVVIVKNCDAFKSTDKEKKNLKKENKDLKRCF